jgi:hypothetical protein
MADQQLIKFKADLDKFSKALDLTMGQAIRRAVIQVSDGLAVMTPVDTGRAAGSYGIDFDQPGTFEQPASFSGGQEAAGAAIKNQQAKLADLDANPYRQVWIYNHLPYIIPLNEGHSQQAPAGFIESVVAEVEAEIGGLLTRAAKDHGIG